MRAVDEPRVGDDHEFIRRGVEPGGPPGEGAVGDGDVVAEGHEANLVVGVPRFHATDEDVGAGRLEFAGDGLDVVGENVEGGVRRAFAEEADGAVVVVEADDAHFFGEGSVAGVVAAAEMDGGGGAGADAGGEFGDGGLGRVAEGKVEAEEISYGGEKFLRLEHAVEAGAVGEVGEFRVMGEGGRVMPEVFAGVAADVAVEAEGAGEGDAPAFGAGELGGAAVFELGLGGELFGDVEAGEGVAVMGLVFGVFTEPGYVEFEHGAAGLGESKSSGVLEHLVSEATKESDNNHCGEEKGSVTRRLSLDLPAPKIERICWVS